MPTISPAIDPTLPAPLPVLYGADALATSSPIDPEPEPGPTDTPWVPPLFSENLRVQVLLTDAVTHEVVDEIRTAVVADFDEDVDFGVPCSAGVDASLWDSVWSQVATRTTAGRDGGDRYGWTPKLHGLEVGVNGKPKWVGIFRQPLDHGPDRMLLPARSYNALFTEDTLGRVEQLDLYNGWGDFERFPVGSTPPGMEIPGDMSAVVVYDHVRGVKCLQVTGPGWVRCPKIALPGDAQTGRTAEGSAFGRWPVDLEVGEPTIYTFCRRSDASENTNQAASVQRRGVRPDSGNRWSDDPVSSGCVMSESTITHQTWVELRGHPAGVKYDLVRLQQGILTGFLSETDGAYYVQRVLRDAQDEGLGGFPYGCTVLPPDSLVGHDEFQMTWNHNGTYSVADVLSAAMDREGGAEAYWNARHEVHIAGRLGRVRDDLLLSNDNTIEATWAIDPGAEVDDYVALTGRGSGTSMLASTVSQPRYPNRHRITRIVRAPNERTINQTDAWALRHARTAARQQATGTALVSWGLGDEIAKGDVVPVAFEAGVHGWWEPVRVLNKRWLPGDVQCLLTWGAVDAGE